MKKLLRLADCFRSMESRLAFWRGTSFPTTGTGRSAAVGQKSRLSSKTSIPHVRRLFVEELEDRRLLSVSPKILPDSVQNLQEPDLETAMLLSEAQSTEEILSLLGQSLPEIPGSPIVQQVSEAGGVESDFNLREYYDYNTLVSNLDVQNGTITVTTLSDYTDPSDGHITLREAISYAGTCGLGTFIQFDIAGTLSLRDGEILLNKSLTIIGGNHVVIDACQQSRVLYVSEGVTATLSGLTFKNGKVAGEGGGIYNAGDLTLSECTITRNSVIGIAGKDENGDDIRLAKGGGIYNKGTMTIVNCTISGNSVSARGRNATPEGKDIYNYNEYCVINHTLPPDFSLPNIDITVAVLTPITERLGKAGTLILDASNSYGAAAYWWDLNSDGMYDYVTQAPYITLCGENYSSTISGNMISWEELESLGYDSGDAINVTLATATASGAASLNSQTSSIKIQAAALNALSVSTMSNSAISNGINSFLNTSKTQTEVYAEYSRNINPEIVAKDIAYDSFISEEDRIEAEDGTTYVVDKIIAGSSDTGFRAVALVKVDAAGNKSNPIIGIRGTVSTEIKSILSDADALGAGYKDFLECKETLLSYMKTWSDLDDPVELAGQSMGGGQVMRTLAYATNSEIKVKSAHTYNAVGISYIEAALFKSQYVEEGVTDYLVRGDVVSLAGQTFLYGNKVTHYEYSTNDSNKHTRDLSSYTFNGISGSIKIGN